MPPCIAACYLVLFVHHHNYWNNLGRKISQHTGELLEVQFLFQRISVLIQRFNSVLFHGIFPAEDDSDT